MQSNLKRENLINLNCNTGNITHSFFMNEPKHQFHLKKGTVIKLYMLVLLLSFGSEFYKIEIA